MLRTLNVIECPECAWEGWYYQLRRVKLHYNDIDTSINTMCPLCLNELNN